MGFGAACNAGAWAGSAGMLLFLNVDTAADAGVFHALDEAAAARPQAGGSNAGSFREMGHHFDPVTLETPWTSGAAFCVRRPVFTAVGGFDEHIFMYCEDIDLSWRIRARRAVIMCRRRWYIICAEQGKMCRPATCGGTEHSLETCF